MHFICENMAGIYIAVVSGLMAWVFGGTRSDLLLQVAPWLLLFMTEVIFFFPQKGQFETSTGARERCWHDMKKDPLVWTAVVLLALLLVPFLNYGLCPICDALQIAEGNDPEPLVPWLPFCVNKMNHLNVVLWFATALSCMVATKHCLSHHGKRTMLEMIVWNGAALAILGFVEAASEAPGPFWTPLPNGVKASDFFSSFGYPNMAGDFFTSIFGLSLALWRWRHESVREEMSDGSKRRVTTRHAAFWRQNYLLIPAVLCLFAALNTLSRASIMLVTALALVVFAHTFISFLHHHSKASRVRRGTISLLALAIVFFAASLWMPEKMQREVDTLNSTAVLDRVTGKGQYHIRVATALWKEHFFFGCGGWGYKHLSVPLMTDAEFEKLQQVGGINVHNDYLQFLAEHGLVGFGLMVALVVMLIYPAAAVWKKLARDIRFSQAKNKPPKPRQIFVLPAPVFIILMTALATLVHSFGDCPMRSPAVLSLFFIELASMPAFLPELEYEEVRHRHHHHHRHHHDSEEENKDATR